MCIKSAQFAVAPILILSCVCFAPENAPAKLILKVDENISGPFGGQKESSCLRVYADGKVLYARRWNSAVAEVDKNGKESREEHTVSVKYLLESGDVWELSSFLESRVLADLPSKFAPPHRPIDYFETVTVKIISSNGTERQISTREFYVASLEEKTRYPSALIVLMSEIEEIENEANNKGRPSETPSDCPLRTPKQQSMLVPD
jgi:hypothetical protein